jgi:hypothetical protein
VPYQQVSGGYTVFPTRGRPDNGAGRSSRPCTFGPRGEDGLCPKKPRSSGSGRRSRKPLKVPRSLSYAKSTSKNPLRTPSAVEALAGGLTARQVLRKATAAGRAAAAASKGLSASALLKAAPGRVGGLVGAAGLAAYMLTRFGLSKYAAIKATKRENAARAADAYRALRLKMAEDQGRPLTKSQQKQLSTIFKNELLKLGLSSRDLSGIMGRSAYDTSAAPYSEG